MQYSIPYNPSSVSSQTNFEYFQMMESNLRKDNHSQISEKAKHFILAKDIKKFENEQRVKQASESVNTSLAFPSDRANYLSVDQKYEKSNNTVTLKGMQTTQSKQQLSASKQFLSPLEFNKSKMTLNPPEIKRNISITSLQQNQKGMEHLLTNESNSSTSKSINFQMRKYIGPNPLQVDDLVKEKNIFLEKNNPINHSMYREFNIGPRIDTNGKIVQYTLVGSPQWFLKQKDMQDKSLSRVRRSSQIQKESFSKTEEENKLTTKAKSIYQSKASTDNAQQNSSFGKQFSIATEKSFVMRPDTTQSAIKQQVQTKKKVQKKNEQTIEVSKDELIKELRQIEKRHQMSVQMEEDTIKHMPLEQQNIFTRDKRVLENHQKHLSDWDRQINKLAQYSQRQATDSAMLRGEQHRRKIEYAQAFDNLKTEDERFGKRIWYMYLRKYPKEKNQNGEEEEDGNKTSHRRYKTDGVNQQYNQKDEVVQKQSKVVMNLPQIDEINNNKKKQKVKLRDLIDPNENTQSDIFSGFMTVTINDQNREIEVIRNTQDPSHFHLSSSSAFSAYKRTSSQFFIESKVRESQQKLKGKMVILEQPINDFIVIGKNKLEEEKKSLLESQNRIFTKVIQEPAEEIVNKKKYSISSTASYQPPNQITKKPPQSEIITQDYDINELSRTGQYFFPNFVEKLSNVSSQFMQ